MASAVPKKCSDSETAINPVRENKTPTRQTSRSPCFAGRPAIIIEPSPALAGRGSRALAQPSIAIKRLVRGFATTPCETTGEISAGSGGLRARAGRANALRLTRNRQMRVEAGYGTGSLYHRDGHGRRCSRQGRDQGGEACRLGRDPPFEPRLLPLCRQD